MPERQLSTPARFMPPVRLGNWEYFLPSESQGADPWCAAFGICAMEQAAFWRRFGYPVQFIEGRCYAEAKRQDADGQDGTTLERVIQVAGSLNLSDQPNLRPPVIDARATEDAADLPWVLHQYGAMLCGLQIDEGWNTPRQPDYLITPRGKKLDGHAIVADWYDLDKARVGGLNWWGTGGERWSMTIEDFASQFFYGYGLNIKWEG
jgi:hypothetical protein